MGSDQFPYLVYYLAKWSIISLRSISDELNIDKNELYSIYQRVAPKITKKTSSRHSDKNQWKKKLIGHVQVPSDGFVLNQPLTQRIILKKLDNRGMFMNVRKILQSGLKESDFTLTITEIMIYFKKWGVNPKSEKQMFRILESNGQFL